MKELDSMALAMVYQFLPRNIQKKIIVQILNNCGFKFSLDDLEEPKFEETVAIPEQAVYIKPAIYCSFCREKLYELEEGKAITTELEAEKLDEHLDKCVIFQVIERHRRRVRFR